MNVRLKMTDPERETPAVREWLDKCEEALDRGHEPAAITFNGISVKVVNPILSFRDGDWHEPR